MRIILTNSCFFSKNLLIISWGNLLFVVPPEQFHSIFRINEVKGEDFSTRGAYTQFQSEVCSFAYFLPNEQEKRTECIYCKISITCIRARSPICAA